MKNAAALALACGLFFTNANAAEPETGAAKLVREYRDGLVFVEGKAGKGSGFIAEVKGKKFLFTNAHVLAGIKNAKFELLDRTPVQIGASFAAVGHDMVAVTVLAGGTALPSVASVDKETSIGDDVVVLGNAEGAGVVNLLQGKLTGIGPNLVEVDAPFVPGNSGSPIIHVPTGKVIGIATYLTIKKTGPREEKVRRFGYRLDSVQKWQPIEWNRFYAEADAMSGIEKTTGEFVKLLNDFGRNGRPTREYEAPAIRAALDNFNRSRSQRGGQREADRAVETLLMSLKSASQSDVTVAKTRFAYDFFIRQLDDEARDREEISKVFDQALKPRGK
jgi:Trypsin-like peptidase domain